MMQNQYKQDLQDRFDDAAFALMMDAYAEEEGARLLQEFEQGFREDIPESLDQKWRRTIDAHFFADRRKARWKKGMQMASKAAIVAIVLLALSVTMCMSVEAIREPVLKYIIEHFERSTSISFIDKEDISSAGNIEDFLLGILPDDFTCVHFENEEGLLHAFYEDPEGRPAALNMLLAGGSYHFDSEDAVWEERKLLHCDAFYLKEDDRLQMIWIDEDVQLIYNFYVTGVREEEFLAMCDILARTLSTYYMESAEAAANKAEQDPEGPVDLLSGILPDQYEPLIVEQNGKDLSCIYQSAAGDLVSFLTYPGLGELELRASGDHREIQLMNYDAILIVTNCVEVIWADETNEIVYHLAGGDLTEEQVLAIAEYLAASITMDIFEYAPEKQMDPPKISSEDFLRTVLPGYLETSYSSDSNGLITASYRNSDGDTITFEMTPIGNTSPFDSNGKDTEVVLLIEYMGMLVEEDGYRMVWADADTDIKFTVTASSMDREAFVTMCRNFVLNFNPI